jgi:hypothetical protein
MCDCCEPRFMSQVRGESFSGNFGVTSVRLTHLPTGIIVTAKTKTEAIQELGDKLSAEHPCYFKPVPPLPVDQQLRGIKPRPWKYRVC